MKIKSGKEVIVGDIIATHRGELRIVRDNGRVANGSWDEMRGSDRSMSGVCGGVSVTDIIIGDLSYRVE